METTAIIQFIGIVLFSSAIPNDPGVHAILPRIDQEMHAQHKTRARNGDPRKPAGVEDHVAVILYRGKDVISRRGNWKRTGALKNQWQYVELDGEQVQFLTNGMNSEPKIPGDLPRAVAPTSACLLNTTRPIGFKDEFQGPTYKGAAGVIDIPLGVLNTCMARTRTEASRVDTTLLMKTEGLLVIAAKKPSEATARTITLVGDAIVYVANVPPKYLFTGIAEPPVGDPHWEAYTAMLDTPCHDKPEGVSLTRECDLSALSTAWKLAQSRPPAIGLEILDSSCSNTQWP